MKLRARLLRTLGAATIAGFVSMAIATPSSGATDPPAQVYQSLHGEGAWSVFGPLVSWQNELATAPSYVDLNYTAHGSSFGRQDLVAGRTDFAISGVPFSAADLATVKGGAAAFIDAPVQVATLATFVEPMFARPVAQFRTVQQICDPDDDSTWPQGVTSPLDCVVRAPYTGPVRIPNRNLAAMFFHFSGTSNPRLWAWNNPDILRAFGLDPSTSNFDTDQLAAGPGFAGRSDPDEITYYLQQFVKQAAPDVWQGVQDLDRRIQWEPITERFPAGVRGVTRDGAEQQVDQLAQSGCGVDGVCGPLNSGGVAPAPPALLRSFRSAYPDQAITFAQVQNANGDWVAPTPDAINKAVDAGGDSPLYALSNPVPDAYPIVWVDHLYAPAHGLSVEKTEALAMLIRYLATTGQDKEQSVGEGRLSPPLVAKALAAANELVISNCTGTDRQVVNTSDPGPLAPPSATALKSIGNMLHCQAVPSATTTTLAPSSSTTTVPTTAAPISPTGFDNGDSAVTDPQTPVVDGATGGVSTPPDDAATSGDTSGGDVAVHKVNATLVTATRLPLVPPGGATGTDRLAAFLLGVLLYLLFRAPVARFARRMTT